MRTCVAQGWILSAMCVATASGAAGCGSFPRVALDAGDGAMEADDGPDADVDAAPDAPDAQPRACDPGAPFGEPVLVPNVNSAAEEFEASLSPDEKTIYIASSRPEGPMGINMFSATRLATTDDFGAVALLANVNSDALDENPTVTSDGKHLYFASNRDALGFELYVASRAVAMGNFGPAQPVAGVNSRDIEGTPYIIANGDVLYFDSDRGHRGRDIYRASHSGGSPTFNVIELKDDLSVDDVDDQSPVVSDDELTVYFASSRAGDLDIWEAHRATTAERFPMPTRVLEPVSSAADDHPVWLSADGCRLLLSSKREGRRRLYLASRPPG